MTPEAPDAERIRAWGGLKNCRRNRRKNARICRDCPFRELVEAADSVEGEIYECSECGEGVGPETELCPRCGCEFEVDVVEPGPKA